MSDPRTRRVFIDEIFPQTDIQQGQQQVINTLDMSLYPDERGPYNYNPVAAATNTLPNPAGNWGGIMRQFSSTDFEQQNVEYIQFWLMDPFIDDPMNNGGTLTINIGSISEDIVPDNRKQFENGLPEDGGTLLTNETVYGKVPQNQSLVYAFDTQGVERNNQDIGFDGLSDAEEAAQFGAFDPADPAADNYEFFLAADGNILERYKNYNGTEGNSPTDVTQDNRGSTTLPDVEDVNRDNTMNTINAYYSYEVELRPGMNSTTNRYISDEININRELPNGDIIPVRWVQFRVPIRQTEDPVVSPGYSRVGSINDFRAIRFMRLYMTDFEVDTYLRLGTLDLVRGDYRQFTQNLREDGMPTTDDTIFEVQGVNIENNATRSPVGYALPPGIAREELRNQNQNIRQNEQSLALRVCGLQPEDARAVFKNVRIDMRQYETLEMFTHLDNGNFPASNIEDDQIEAFIRLGVDFTQNYYEIRLPLKVTAPNTMVREEIWPTENNFVIDFSVLQEIKSLYLGSTTFNPNEFATITTLPSGQAYGIKGNPSFGDVRALMIGVRNATTNEPVCGEVWFNELRLSGLKNEGGYAALLNMDTNLADFASISANGARSTIGFGGIEEGPNERSRENATSYDVTTSLSLGMLLPQKWGVNIPFSYSIAEETVTPQFDPQFQDIELETRLDNAATDADREVIREQSEEYTRRQSINFIGVSKERTGESAPMPYDIENFTFSGSYNQTDSRNFEIEEFQEQSINAGATYAYAFPDATLEPFKDIEFLNNRYWQSIKDFNINLLPTNFAATSNVIRQYNFQQFRDLQLDTNPVDIDGDGTPDAQNISIDPLTNRNFTMDHSYAINWQFTKSLQMTLSANSDRVIRSYINDDNTVDEDYTIWTDFLDAGIPDTHAQKLQMTYNLPLSKIPFLAFAKADYTYTADFLWQRNSQQFQQLDDIPDLGNTISNANTHVINGTLDFDRLYSYVGLEKLDFTPAGERQQRARPRSRSRNRTAPAPAPTQNNEEKEKVPEKNFVNQAYNTFVGLVTAIERAQINYSESNGIFLPGYTQNIGFLGTLKPTTGFVFGSQAEIRDLAARRGWLTLFQDFNQQYTETETRRVDYNVKVGLLDDLSIDLQGQRLYQENFSENYVIDPDNLTYQSLTPNTFGNFNISTIMLRTAFQSSNIDGSEVFNTFRENRISVANRLAREYYGDDNFVRDDDGFPRGFSRNSQQVLLPSFLAAYEGRDVEKQDNDLFRDIPLPNWQVKYTGLMNLAWFKKYFNRFSINHGYRSELTLNQFQTNLDFVAGNPSLSYAEQNPDALNQSGDFKSANLLFNVNLTESFSPLFKLDFEMKNSVSVAAEWRKDRALSLSFDNNLLTEINGNEYILGLGYRIKDLRIKTKWQGRSVVLKSDLTLELQGSVRDNITIIRYLDLDNSQATAGQTIYGLKFNADYNISRALTAIFYYDHTFSEFAISTAFPQSTIRSGITLRYTFGN